MVDDFFTGRTVDRSDPGAVHFDITPSDTVDLPRLPKALYVTGDGDLSLQDREGNVLLYPVSAGQVLPFRPVRVRATGTTATVIGWTG